MRILFTLHNFFPERVYGTEWVCIQQMRELLQRGHRVGLFYAGNRPVARKTLVENGLEGLECFPIKFLNTKAQVILSVLKPWVTRRFKQVVDRFSPEAVIYHHLVRLSLDLPLVSHAKGIVSIFYLHDFYLICPSYSLLRPDGRMCSGGGAAKCAACLFATRFKRLKPLAGAAAMAALPILALRRTLIRHLVTRVSGFVSPSRFLVRKLNDQGLHPDPVAVIPNGGEPVSGARRWVDPDPRTLRFGYLGGIFEKKGIEVLVAAFAGEMGKRLTIRGFRDEGHLQRFRADHPDCCATLEVFDPDRDGFFQKVDVVVLPSVWYENQPSVVVEAFSHGKPVICSDLGALPEMVEDKVCGLLFKTGDAEDLNTKVRSLIDHPEILDRLTAGIPVWPSVSDNVDRLLDAIASQRRAA